MSQNHVYYLAANEMFEERKKDYYAILCVWMGSGLFLPKPTGVPTKTHFDVRF